MKKILIFLLCLNFTAVFAQRAITSGTIEYEVKVNQHRQNEGNEWFQNMKDRMPQFSVDYYKLSFNNNQSIYTYDRSGDKGGGRGFMSFGRNDKTGNIWYNNYNDTSFVQTVTLDDVMLFSGKQKKLDWKIFPGENRDIAGFNCRKAQTILFDSVYVFVYYTDDIAISGGPMNLNGLPGVILGVTVPRLFTSWMATAVTLNAPDNKLIAAPSKGKKMKIDEIKTIMESLTKSWGRGSNDWIQRMYWQTFM
ncbi:MAG: GLPGLI family protein [Chitinophagaceae bacterium]|nr:MAG: GLPGLI family protein [Chitinophagaceae bacterium]